MKLKTTSDHSDLVPEGTVPILDIPGLSPQEQRPSHRKRWCRQGRSTTRPRFPADRNELPASALPSTLPGETVELEALVLMVATVRLLKILVRIGEVIQLVVLLHCQLHLHHRLPRHVNRTLRLPKE